MAVLSGTLLAQLVISGIQVGSIYALVGLGIVLLYRTSRVLNFAHGEMSLVAAYVAFSLISGLRLPLGVAFALSMLAAGLVALLFYWVLVRRAKANNPLGLLILTLGFGFFANALMAQIWGTDLKNLPTVVDVIDTWQIGGLVISKIAVITAAVGFAVMLGLYLFIQRTRVGLAMRAVAQNPDAARSLGIPVQVVLSSTWVAAALLGGAAALLFVPTIGATPTVMLDPVNKGFAAAVLGGITSLPGAVLGAYILGVAESILGFLYPSTKLVLAFVVIVVVLVVRPDGLLGEPERKRA